MVGVVYLDAGLSFSYFLSVIFVSIFINIFFLPLFAFFSLKFNTITAIVSKGVILGTSMISHLGMYGNNNSLTY